MLKLHLNNFCFVRLCDYWQNNTLKTSEFHCELGEEIYFWCVIIITRNFYITYSRAPFALEFRPLKYIKHYNIVGTTLLQRYNSAIENINVSHNDHKKHFF